MNGQQLSFPQTTPTIPETDLLTYTREPLLRLLDNKKKFPLTRRIIGIYGACNFDIFLYDYHIWCKCYIWG